MIDFELRFVAGMLFVISFLRSARERPIQVPEWDLTVNDNLIRAGHQSMRANELCSLRNDA
jgi:hypothetical protein